MCELTAFLMELSLNYSVKSAIDRSNLYCKTDIEETSALNSDRRCCMLTELLNTKKNKINYNHENAKNFTLRSVGELIIY